MPSFQHQPFHENAQIHFRIWPGTNNLLSHEQLFHSNELNYVYADNFLPCVVFRHQRRRGRRGRLSLLPRPPTNLLNPPPQIAGAVEVEQREVCQLNNLSSNSARRIMENTTPPSCIAGAGSHNISHIYEPAWFLRKVTDWTPSEKIEIVTTGRFGWILKSCQHKN